MKVSVLGTDYKIQELKMSEDAILEGCDGYCDNSVKKIVIAQFERGKNSIEDLDDHKKKVIRHELSHAFLFESGLHVQCDWARSEEMVDWIAIQFPKLVKAMEQTNSL